MIIISGECNGVYVDAVSAISNNNIVWSIVYLESALHNELDRSLSHSMIPHNTKMRRNYVVTFLAPSDDRRVHLRGKVVMLRCPPVGKQDKMRNFTRRSRTCNKK